MKRVTLIITAVLTVLMLTACSSNKVVYESNTESQGGNKAWTVLIYMCGGDDESVNGDYSKKLDEIMNMIEHEKFELETFDNVLIRKLIECIKVLSKTEILVIFKGGYEVRAEIE